MPVKASNACEGKQQHRIIPKDACALHFGPSRCAGTKSFRTMATSISRNQVVVRGGSLGESEGWWLSCLEIINGCEFISLSSADLRLAAYVGRRSDAAAGCARTGFLEVLRRIRNRKVGDLMQSFLDEESSQSGGMKRRKIDLFDQLDKVITVDVPELEISKVTTLKVLATARTQAKVSVHLTQENLEYIREACRTFVDPGDTPQKSRRSGDDLMLVDGCPDVHWNDQRRSWWIRWTDGDGRVRHKSFVFKRSDVAGVQDENRVQAARDAQREFDRLDSEAEARSQMDESQGDETQPAT